MGAAASAIPSGNHGLSSNMIVLVKQNMQSISTHSWEIGTMAEALTELEYAPLSVFSAHSIPPHVFGGKGPIDVAAIADVVVANKTPGMLPLYDGLGATGDPASIGQSVLLTEWTLTGNLSPEVLGTAATEQLEYLLVDAPRAPDGTISQRESEVQFWSDYTYMVPPFLAYYGALQHNKSVLHEAYNQCMLYRQHLQDPMTGLWRHIEEGSFQDNNLWATGNGWAASGMMRVLATIRHSAYSVEMIQEQSDITKWVGEIIKGAWSFQHANGTLFNYINNSSTFPDSSGTAMIAAATYRWAKITGDHSLIPNAQKAFGLIQANLSPDGWLQDVVDPETFDSPATGGNHSPEGQSFTLLLQSAWRDYHTGV